MSNKVVHVRNLLEGKTCTNCVLTNVCKSRLQKRVGTCAKWTNDYGRKFLVKWSSFPDLNINAEEAMIKAVSFELKKELDRLALEKLTEDKMNGEES